MDVLRYQKANCKDCYKCIRRCAVKAIAVRDHHTEVIDEDCVLCGRCVLTCPQYANQARWDIQPVRRLLQSERPWWRRPFLFNMGRTPSALCAAS